MLVSQLISHSRLVLLPPRFAPYAINYFLFPVITHLLVAAFCFAIGTIGRNTRLVYGSVLAAYFGYSFFQLLVKNLPPVWRVALDPLGFNWAGIDPWRLQAGTLNQLTFNYDWPLILNRMAVVIAAFGILLITSRRFKPREGGYGGEGRFDATGKWLTGAEASRINSQAWPSVAGGYYPNSGSAATLSASMATIVPSATVKPGTTIGRKSFPAVPDHRSVFTSLLSAELSLLKSSRGNLVLLPLAFMMSTLELLLLRPEGSPSIGYASNASRNLTFILAVLIIFYLGETFHREKELRIEPLLWVTRIPNWILISSKLASVFIPAALFALAVSLGAILAQVVRGHFPVSIAPFLFMFSLLIIPNLLIIIGLSMTLNSLITNKHLVYALSIAAAGTLIYLIQQGYNHWFYTPVIASMPFTTDDVSRNPGTVLLHRMFWLSSVSAGLAISLLVFKRRTLPLRRSLSILYHQRQLTAIPSTRFNFVQISRARFRYSIDFSCLSVLY